ncbi:MAG TPA: ATP-binding protein, partial [Burkholderiaceae bacterium]
PSAVVALLDDDGGIANVASRASVLAHARTVELAPAALPSAHYALLRQALDAGPQVRARAAPLEDGALRLLPLMHGDRLLGALWVDGETSALGAALLEEVAERASMAFAAAVLHQELQVEIAERRQAEARLAQESRRKDEFLAMLSHELRNPLAPIRNAVEVIRLVAPPEQKLRWAADVTDRQVRQLTRLVDELLDVARISQGKIVLQPQCLDLVSLVSQCVETQRPAIAGRGQSLALALPGAPVLLNGDATRLAQVVNNLLTNAVKYTPEGGAIAIGVDRGSGPDGDFALLAVEDDGIGIEPELLPHVFELFEQGKRALDRTQGGLGVGLTLVQRLVLLHGGEVTAASEGPGRGSSFRVRLPCLAVDDAMPPSPRGAGEGELRAVRRRVLVVEDNADVAETTAMLLSLSGHEVVRAKDGLQALQVAAEFAPEVVLLDIGLPLMDGYEVARRLRRLPQTEGARLVALTGYGQQADRQRGREAGFDSHLLKPVDPDALRAVLAA